MRPDVVFTARRICVFSDGCFWHRCPDHATNPKINSGYWRPKLDANFERDRRVDRALEAAGWTVLRVWEHEDPAVAAARVADIVSRSPHRPQPPRAPLPAEHQHREAAKTVTATCTAGRISISHASG